MGQDLYYPPNVGGWSEGRAWLGSQGILARTNFAAALVDGRIWNPVRSRDLRRLAERHRPGNDLAESVAWFAELLWGAADVAMVTEVTAATSQESPESRLPIAVALLLARPEAHLC
jgi:hypothetical protein